LSVTLCILVGKYQRFGGNFYLYLHGGKGSKQPENVRGSFLRNFGTYSTMWRHEHNGHHLILTTRNPSNPTYQLLL